MSETTSNTSETETQTLTAEQKELFEKSFNEVDQKFVEIVQLDKLEQNSVLIFRVARENLNLIMSLPILCEKYKDVFQPKNIAILVVGPDEKVESLNEQEMNRIGWERKDKSRIITLS